MLKNYIKIAWRNLTKNKVYSFINIFGLAVGIACCILIALYVHNEWNFDAFHSKSDQIYRAWAQESTQEGKKFLNTATPVPMGPALSQHIPEVERVTYIYTFGNLVNTADRPEPLNENIMVTNADFFRMFDFEVLKGDANRVFENPSSVVLTEETAKRFFGNKDPMQQTLSIRMGNEFQDFMVTGIIEKAPANSSFQYHILIPYDNLKKLIGEEARNSWFNIYGGTYVMFKKGTDVSKMNGKLEAMMKGILGEDFYAQTPYKIGFQPLTDIHLNTTLPKSAGLTNNLVTYSYILAAIALLILLIACVNFMTLSISKSTARAKEVGIRKTIGALRQHLMYQFWGEALLMTLLALALGVVFTEILLPFFNDLSGTSLQFKFTLPTVIVMLAGGLFISLIAGIYPALILSGFRPMEVLKGRLSVSGDKSFFRKAMVTFQFTLSIALITGTIIVHRQLNYVQNKDLGYQKDKIVVLESGFSNSPQSSISDVIADALRRKNVFRNKLNAIPEVEGIVASSFTPVQMAGWFRLGFRDDKNQQYAFHGNIVDADFVSTMGIKLIQGRNFSDENPSDQHRAIVVNQALVDYFGWEHPIGQRLPGPGFDDHEVIGVVENFHYESLHTKVEPLVMAMSPELLFSGINNMVMNNSASPRYSLKISSDNLSATMARVKKSWEEIAPGTPFDFTFVDQALDSQYRQDQRLSRIVTSGSILAIIIACLGLFGLASLMIARRTKEIGVRKVLGASSSNIVLLINKEFTKLVAVAFVIAVPISWYAMSQWLKDFAYRIDISLWIFLMAGLTALVIAWLTVTYQSFKATLINPVDSLKNE